MLILDHIVCQCKDSVQIVHCTCLFCSCLDLTYFAGQFFMQMCTVMKCDPDDISTCEQWLYPDQDFLSGSTTVFSKLSLSGTFSPSARVYPQVVFDETTLRPDLYHILDDGVVALTGRSISLMAPTVSMSLFGRIYQMDGNYPENWCPQLI